MNGDPETSCETELTSDQELVSNPCLLLRPSGTLEIYGSGVGFSEMPWIDEILNNHEIFWVEETSWYWEISWSDMILLFKVSWFDEISWNSEGSWFE